MRPRLSPDGAQDDDACSNQVVQVGSQPGPVPCSRSLQAYQHGTGATRMQPKTIFQLVTESTPWVVEQVVLIEEGTQACSAEGIADRFDLRSAMPWIRQPANVSSFRLHSVVDDPGRVGFSDASREVSDVRCESLARSVGRRKKSSDDRRLMVPKRWGSPDELEGSSDMLSDELGSR